MKSVGKLIIGVILLIIGFILATHAGTLWAGGETKGVRIPIKIEYELKGN